MYQNTVPAYTDISHFRAPYKNSMIAGFGADPPQEGMVEQDSRGYFRLIKGVQEIFNTSMESYAVDNTGADMVQIKKWPAEVVAASLSSPEARKTMIAFSAKTWIDNHAAGNVIVMPMTGILAVAMDSPTFPEGANILAAFKSGSDMAKSQSKVNVVVAGDPEAAGLARIISPSSMASAGPLTTGLVVAGAALGGYLIYKAIKRGSGGRGQGSFGRM